MIPVVTPGRLRLNVYCSTASRATRSLVRSKLISIVLSPPSVKVIVSSIAAPDATMSVCVLGPIVMKETTELVRQWKKYIAILIGLFMV